MAVGQIKLAARPDHHRLDVGQQIGGQLRRRQQIEARGLLVDLGKAFIQLRRRDGKDRHGIERKRTGCDAAGIGGAVSLEGGQGKLAGHRRANRNGASRQQRNFEFPKTHSHPRYVKAAS
jgi:hypothetical protein